MTILNEPVESYRFQSNGTTKIDPLIVAASGTTNGWSSVPTNKQKPLLDTFLRFHAQAKEHRSGEPILVDGHSLSIPAVFVNARYSPKVLLSRDPCLQEQVESCRRFLLDKMNAGKSIYGVSTGFGGSADTRSDKHDTLGLALLQHQHIGILPSNLENLTEEQDNYAQGPRLLQTPMSSSMPSAWVRGAILIRSNSLIRGHSAIRWGMVESMANLLNKNITPIVPLRSSISASGDLSPLSYIGGTVMGFPNIFVRCPSSKPGKSVEILPASEALSASGLEPFTLRDKEHLGMINGTSFSASVGSLIAYESVGAIILAEVCTALGTEALLGTQANFASFIAEARPHPGQIEAAGVLFDLLKSSSLATPAEAHADEVTIDVDQGELRQDRYPIRTAPQWLGPLIEDVLSAVKTVEIEINSTTDNPIFDAKKRQVHHGGNFQALSLTTSFEKTRLALFLIAKLVFSQATELLNPLLNHGLAPSAAATDPSLNYHAKGLDIAMASYVSELGWLAGHVATNVQSAEMHNQSVNSLALISGRATLNALEVLNMLFASCLYVLCQALDIRALQKQFKASIAVLLAEELRKHLFSDSSVQDATTIVSSLSVEIIPSVYASLDSTTTMDAAQRLDVVASAIIAPLFEGLSKRQIMSSISTESISALRKSFAERGITILNNLRRSYLSGEIDSSYPVVNGSHSFNPRAPAAHLLGRTRPVYEFIRLDLKVPMHGLVNLEEFKSPDTLPNVGQNVSYIYEAIRDGRMHDVLAGIWNQP
ncbi:hypothetical protein Clacol_002702 [Clathrus columnatus]|uniref:Phenylalanine ammonia-lyase n=1 Tax=Clathrus columnatus TaxID=1419009 RepID=A0AAV5A6W8_9AGAM|nr:hypothetical protein Clacol_002702 [Clathrus columnatus]